MSTYDNMYIYYKRYKTEAVVFSTCHVEKMHECNYLFWKRFIFVSGCR